MRRCFRCLVLESEGVYGREVLAGCRWGLIGYECIDSCDEAMQPRDADSARGRFDRSWRHIPCMLLSYFTLVLWS